MGQIPVILRGARVLTIMMVLIFTVADGRSKLHSFEDHEVVPDVVKKAPAALAKSLASGNPVWDEVVTVVMVGGVPGGVEVKEGNELTPTQVKDEPTVTWNANPDEFYTLCMTEPDAPSREEPKFREWHHWLVGNIPGENIVCGETLSEYIGAGPPKDTGLHRYVFLVYQQPGKLAFDEPRLTNTSDENRPNFSINKFSSKYKLGHPIAGNFFQAEYDE